MSEKVKALYNWEREMSNGVGSASSLKISINLSERDIIKLVVEFLHSRDLHISQLDLERETGVINSQHSDDVLFLRQLVLDGQWDDVLEFIAPLKQMSTFDAKQFTYIVMKHQYLELLCLKVNITILHGLYIAQEIFGATGVQRWDYIELLHTEIAKNQIEISITKKIYIKTCSLY